MVYGDLGQDDEGKVEDLVIVDDCGLLTFDQFGRDQDLFEATDDMGVGDDKVIDHKAAAAAIRCVDLYDVVDVGL
jgi:hypothetical protein